jgi:hypothetical protein
MSQLPTHKHNHVPQLLAKNRRKQKTYSNQTTIEFECQHGSEIIHQPFDIVNSKLKAIYSQLILQSSDKGLKWITNPRSWSRTRDEPQPQATTTRFKTDPYKILETEPVIELHYKPNIHTTEQITTTNNEQKTTVLGDWTTDTRIW